MKEDLKLANYEHDQITHLYNYQVVDDIKVSYNHWQLTIQSQRSPWTFICACREHGTSFIYTAIYNRLVQVSSFFICFLHITSVNLCRGLQITGKCIHSMYTWILVDFLYIASQELEITQTQLFKTNIVGGYFNTWLYSWCFA